MKNNGFIQERRELNFYGRKAKEALKQIQKMKKILKRLEPDSIEYYRVQNRLERACCDAEWFLSC